MNALKRETNYLLIKAQRFVPKSKTTTPTPKVPVNEKIKVEDQKSEPEETTTISTEGIKFNSFFYPDYFLLIF